MPESLYVALSEDQGAPRQTVTAANFGVNLLFDRDGSTEDRTGMTVCDNFAEAVDVMAATTFRYPGGTIAEALFDLRNPESPDQSGSWQEAIYRAFDPDGAGPMEGVTLTLCGALDFARQSGTTMTFVMPTYCFLGGRMDANGHRWANVNVDLVQGFVQRLLDEANERGVTVAAIEIGNEWYGDYLAIFGTRMTPVEYGRVASSLAAVIQEAIDTWKATRDEPEGWQEPDIAIQVGQGGNGAVFRADGHFIEPGYIGPTATATELIFREFNSAAERAAIDGLISHRYMSGAIVNADGWSYAPFDEFDTLAAQAGGFGDLDRYVTEWNVSNNNTAVLEQWHACAIVALFSEMIAAGVDHANVWALQQNNRSRLTNNTGLHGEEFMGLTAAGEVWRLMASTLPGLSHVESGDSLDGVQTNVFTSESRAVIYIGNTGVEPVTFTFDAGQVLAGFSYGWATLIRSAPDGASADPEVEILTGRQLFQDGAVPLTLLAGDVVQIELVSGHGAKVVGYEGRDLIEGSVAGDSLYGEGGADVITAGAGSDSVWGGAGSDRLRGHTGVDVLDGSSGTDTLYGGRGVDHLTGGSGDDALFGGEGDDGLRGGSDGDVLVGGPGSDRLYGGVGADTFIMDSGAGRDVICDFEAGVDSIDVRAWDLSGDALEQVAIESRGMSVWVETPGGAAIVVQNSTISDVVDALIWS